MCRTVQIRTISLISHREDDFRLAAEWNFFATSHGSLQRPYNDQKLTSDAILNFCNENIHGIKFFNVPPEDVAWSETELKVRFELARTVKGTLQFHRFVPVSKSRLNVNRLSAQTNDPEMVPISRSDGIEIGNEAARSLHVQEQSFVCCLYDNFPWIGMVDEISDEYGDYRINFMHPHGPARQFHWQLRKDPCCIPKDDILCCLEIPSLTCSSSRNYCINQIYIVNIS